MRCHIPSLNPQLAVIAVLLHSVSLIDSAKSSVRRYYHLPDSTNSHSIYVPQVTGYNYPGPGINHKPFIVRHETIVASASGPLPKTAPAPPKPVTSKPTALTIGPTKLVSTSIKVKATTEVMSTTEEIAGGDSSDSSFEEILHGRSPPQLSNAASEDNASLLKAEAERMPQIQTIDVACGKERMTVRATFDERFDGIIYAKGHYNDPNCRFIGQNSGQKIYQFDMVVGQCGVAFIDAGLTSGGMAFVEGTLVSLLEPGVQEAWDAARRIRCLWEGNIDQTVTFPLNINMLDSQTLTFSGDTASASLEIQTGRGPRAQPVQGLVRIGELLTAVVTVQGDTEFDLVVRNCVATDGTPENRIILSDNNGCAMKPKLMGGWKKQKNSGTVAAYAFLSAFKFPDVMDLFLECTVSLCKGTCEECSDYMELTVPGNDAESQEGDTANDVGSGTKKNPGIRRRRSVDERYNGRFNETVPAESLRLRRVVHVVGPDDLPEISVAGLRPTVYGGHCSKDCFSLLGVIATAVATLLLMFATLALCGAIRRNHRDEKW